MWVNISDQDREGRAALHEFLFPDLPEIRSASSKATGKRLKKYVDAPVYRYGKMLVLKTTVDSHTKVAKLRVEASDRPIFAHVDAN